MNLKLKRIKELFGYAATLLRQEGAASMLKRAAGFFKRRFFGKKARYLPKQAVLDAQHAADTTDFPVLSVCVPLYNTPLPFLTQLLDSLAAQTCPNWQLCLADASDADHPEVGQLVAARAAQEARICYTKIENAGIAANTNAAARLATGDYLALADHDDVLAPHAVYEMGKAILATGADFLYSDEALFESDIRRPQVGHFKPDFAPEYLLCCNYICHLAAFRRALFEQLGGERSECDGSQDHDLFLRLTECVPPEKIVHLPQVLYYWRNHAASTSAGVAAKPYVAAAAKRALAEHVQRTGGQAEVLDGLFPSTYYVKWALTQTPLISILIPNMDHTEDLDKALHSIFAKSSYPNFEVVVIENNSKEQKTFAYYEAMPQKYPTARMVRYRAEGGFNFSAINNFGRRVAKGEYLLLLNNDVEIITPDWMEQMLRQASRPGVAACGAMLYYPDDTVQHAGIITGLGGFAGHSHKYARRGGSGYMFRMATVQDFSAVTAACLMVRTAVFDELGGLDEQFAVAFNDVDFCLRIRRAGWRIAWTPYAELYHYESKSRGLDEKDKNKKVRFSAEQALLQSRYGRAGLTSDPYYNPSLTLDREDFSESDDLRNLQQG